MTLSQRGWPHSRSIYLMYGKNYRELWDILNLPIQTTQLWLTTVACNLPKSWLARDCRRVLKHVSKSYNFFRVVCDSLGEVVRLIYTKQSVSYGWREQVACDSRKSKLCRLNRPLSPGQTVLPTQANSSQVHNFDGVGDRLATHLAWVGSSWIELAWIWSSSNFRPTRAEFSTVWPPQPTQANSRQVVLLLLCDYAAVFRQLHGFLWSDSTWRYRLATRPCKFWFCNLARVGLSWEYRLARALHLTIARLRDVTCIHHQLRVVSGKDDKTVHPLGVSHHTPLSKKKVFRSCRLKLNNGSVLLRYWATGRLTGLLLIC